MEFEIIGSDRLYYFLKVYDECMVLKHGVYFLKIPMNFFEFMDYKDRTDLELITDIEIYIGIYYKELMEDGFLIELNQKDFLNINIVYEGGDNNAI